MDVKSGSVSISTENIFPIIKKWLYSEKDIFLREVVSNSSDAIHKLKKLIAVGEADLPEEETEWKIEVALDKDAGTITIHDNGIGMTEEEVVKYINQIAFSGAKDFIEKYEGKTDDAQIIGHFGLGFYSTFMVSDKVEIDTLSWIPGSEAVHWESNSGMDYAISPSEIEERGTYVTLHLSEDSKEYLDEFQLKDTLEKYFSFLPVPLYFINVGEASEEAEAEEEPVEEAEEKTEAEEGENHEEGCSCEECQEGQVQEASTVKEPKPLNDTAPLWLKPPKDCTEEEYKAFYHKVFHDFNDPLFWIHLNMDYPFNLKGILYFPKLKNEYDSLEGTIKIYYNQVFVADNIKEILPEFLLLLKGVIDCPDLPLNVSRSFLQNDGYVNKISAHITKKVADKLNGLFETERENYCKYWDDINPFVKYGCLKDEKFYDKVKESILYKTTDDSYVTQAEYAEKYPNAAENTLYYVDDDVQQAQYVSLFRSSGIEAVRMTGPIDSHFMQFMEYKNPGKLKFVRVDADVSDQMKNETSDISREQMDQMAADLEAEFRKVSGNDKLKVRVESIKSGMPAIILLSEQGRRMQEMMKMYGGGMGFPMGDEEVTLVLNESNPTVSRLSELRQDTAREAEYDMICSQIYDLAMLAHKPMDAEGMTKFIERSAQLLNKAI